MRFKVHAGVFNKYEKFSLLACFRIEVAVVLDSVDCI